MDSTKFVINVAKDFGRFPLGRTMAESGYQSAEWFRIHHLIPALREHRNVTVNLDGTFGYGSDFLEEAFGPQLLLSGFDPHDLHNRLTIAAEDDPSLVTEAWSYVDKRSTIERTTRCGCAEFDGLEWMIDEDCPFCQGTGQFRVREEVELVVAFKEADAALIRELKEKSRAPSIGAAISGALDSFLTILNMQLKGGTLFVTWPGGMSQELGIKLPERT